MFNHQNKRGFTLVELAIVLAVASLLFGGLWRLMASGSAQLRDQATADQQSRLIEGIRAYLESGDGQSYVGGLGVGGTGALVIGSGCAAAVCPYLPTEFRTGASGPLNPYSQTYTVRVRNDSTASGAVTAYSFMIMTTAGETIPDTSGGRIASMIGGDGGFIYSTNMGFGTTAAYGAYGAWQASPAVDYGFGGVSSGHVASRTYVGYNADQFSPWLARKNFTTLKVTNASGTQTNDYNTVRANTYMFQSDASATPHAGTNDFYLGNNTFYGGIDTTGQHGQIVNVQTIDNLQKMTINMNSSPNVGLTINMNSATNAGLAINGPCSQATGGCSIYALQINGDGNVVGQLRALQFIYISDAKLKHDIKPLENALEKLSKIRGVSYVLNETNQKKVGLLAQDVEKVFPEAVANIHDGYKGVDYMQLVGPLVSAVNELRERDEALAKQVQEQAVKIEALQKALAPKTNGKK